MAMDGHLIEVTREANEIVWEYVSPEIRRIVIELDCCAGGFLPEPAGGPPNGRLPVPPRLAELCVVRGISVGMSGGKNLERRLLRAGCDVEAIRADSISPEWRRGVESGS
jgi:hypothetical protein